jgi:FkbM family methyltransferase
MPNNGEIVVDVGAAIGKFSLLAAKYGAYVISIETHPITFNSLMKNIELNGFKNMRALNIAVGKVEEKVELYSPKNLY